jgi:hypothetical protein
MLFPTFAKIAQEQNLTLSTAASPGCPWQRNLYDNTPSPELAGRLARCLEMKKDLYERVIPKLKPDVIVATGSDYLTVRPGIEYGPDGKPIPADPAEFERMVKTDTQRSIEQLERSAGKVLIIEPVPATDADHDPYKCLSKSKTLEECRFVANLAPTPLELFYRQTANNRTTFDVDIDKLVCPFMPICDPAIGGQIVRFDPEHITPRFAVSLADPMTIFLRDDRLIRS